MNNNHRKRKQDSIRKQSRRVTAGERGRPTSIQSSNITVGMRRQKREKKRRKMAGEEIK